MAVDDRSAKGIAVALSAAIDHGSLAPGTQLPPIRRAARDLAVAPATVSAAWSQLARAGLIETDGRRGTRVREAVAGPRRYRRALDSQDGFRSTSPRACPTPTSCPTCTPALRRVPRDEQQHSYLEDPVVPALRELLVESWPFPAEQLTVVDGAMDAHSQFVAAHLRFGDRVAVEQPCFPPLLDLLEMAGVVPLPVAYDADGPVVADVVAAMDAGAKVLFFQPWGQNPSGQSLAPGRAEALAAALAGRDVVVVEDDSAGGSPVRRSPLAGHAPARADGAGQELLEDPRPRPAARRRRRTRGRWSTRSSSAATSDRAGAAGCCSRSWSTCSPPGDRGRSWRGPSARTPTGPRRWPMRWRRRGSSYPGGTASTCGYPSPTRPPRSCTWPPPASARPAAIPSGSRRPPRSHIRITTASIGDGYDELAALVAAAARAGSWSGHR